jgi:hypothetical protein
VVGWLKLRKLLKVKQCVEIEIFRLQLNVNKSGATR